ncbi:MAG: AAA domain-containing protein, partial [Janthinobacterium lividum]
MPLPDLPLDFLAFSARLAALATAPAAAPADQLPRLRQLLEQVLRAECRRRQAPFADLSQAIGLVAYDRGLAVLLRRQLQNLRLQANLVLHESYPGTPAEVVTGFGAVAELLRHLGGPAYAGPRPPGAPDAPASEALASVEQAGENPETTGAETLGPPPAASPAWRVRVLHADLASGTLTVELAAPAAGRPTGPFALALPAAYANLLPLAAALHPVLNLIDPAWQPDGRYRPRRVVLEPDYLVNVTTLAECAQAGGTVPDWALLNAFLPDETSRPLVVGNLVNLLLDEEVSHAARQQEWAGPGETPRAPLFRNVTDSLTRAGQQFDLQGTTGDPRADWAPEGPAPPGEPAAAAGLGVPGAAATVETEPSAAPEFDLEAFFKQRLFRSNPLTISALPEFQARNGVPELLSDLRRHYQTLRRSRAQGFVAGSRTGYQQQPLRVADCFLEPAFLSATYGLQGRLDLLHESPTGYDIVELKSSTKVPHAEPWSNHAAQAQLYRLLLESVFGADGETAGRGRTSILYSNAAPDQAPVRRVDQDAELVDRLLAARNQLVGTEMQLARATSPGQVEKLLAPVLQPNLQALPPFGRVKAERIAGAWAAADPVERAYCLEMVRFVAREMRLTLLGDEARPGDAGGQAGLWQLSAARKQQNFSQLDELVLVADHSAAPDDARQGLGPHLIFRRPAGGREVNFRAGDTLILYPRKKAVSAEAGDAGSQALVASALNLSVLDAQVVKVTLAEDLTADGLVVLSVRNRRLAPRYLAGHSHWALEPDTYDTFRREWAGLSAFLSLLPERRQRLLARRGPRVPAGWNPAAAPATDAPEVVARALAAPDWFVLCGPPGTGKTRAVLRELAERLYQDDKQALLAAYTNRAVDEICEQLVAAGLPFIRVGSRLGTAAPYRPYLLDNMIRDCPSRQTVRARLTGCPFYVGTVASLLGKPELFLLKNFDLAVIDEASQVLEGPMLALLAKVPKFILIGDHRQLPAVVAQEPATSAIAPEAA